MRSNSAWASRLRFSRTSGEDLCSRSFHLTAIALHSIALLWVRANPLLTLDRLQVLFVDGVRLRHHLFVPAAITRLVPSQEQQRRSGGIEGIKDTIGPALMLNSQLAHMAKLRALDSAAVGKPEGWSGLRQHQHYAFHAVLFNL